MVCVRTLCFVMISWGSPTFHRCPRLRHIPTSSTISCSVYIDLLIFAMELYSRLVATNTIPADLRCAVWNVCVWFIDFHAIQRFAAVRVYGMRFVRSWTVFKALRAWRTTSANDVRNAPASQAQSLSRLQKTFRSAHVLRFLSRFLQWMERSALPTGAKFALEILKSYVV